MLRRCLDGKKGGASLSHPCEDEDMQKKAGEHSEGGTWWPGAWIFCDFYRHLFLVVRSSNKDLRGSNLHIALMNSVYEWISESKQKHLWAFQ